jgi:hypothetical protein
MVEISGAELSWSTDTPRHAVLYWLDICEVPGDLVAEISIHVACLKCEGDRKGVRWVKALRT